jgi:hypothetical protein
MVARKLERAAKMLERLESRIKPGLKVYVWRARGEFYINKAGDRLRQEELPDGENVINIIIEAV